MLQESIFSLITAPAAILAFFLILILLNIGWVAIYFLMRRKINFFLQGKNAKSMEGVISNLLENTNRLQTDLKKISQTQEKQEKALLSAIKKIGIVRFNPFNNTGGDQSFAIAFLNSEDSGIVISSLYLREGARVYAKPINNLKSQYPLSKEEGEAIKKAIGKI